MAKKKTKIHHDHIAEGLRTLAVDITTLRQDPANARLHNEQNLEAIMSSLSKFGQRKPVVVNKRDGIVEAGNGTLQAAKSLGWSHVAAVFVDDDPATATGFAIADNRTAELATWDEETLGKLLESIGDEMPAIELGFSDEQLAEIMAPLQEDPIGEDIEPTEPPKDPVSQRGEIFELGPHRLMCGDCRDADDWQAIVGMEQVNVVVTSPPYASQRKYDESSGFKPIPPDEYGEWFKPLQALIAQYLADDGSYFLNIKEHCDDGQRHLYVKDLTIQHVREWGWMFVDEFCWTHGGTPKGPVQRFKNGWEPIFQFTRSRHKFNPENVMHKSSDIPDWSGLHPNMESVQQHGTTEGMRKKGVDSRSKKIQKGSNSSLQGLSSGGKQIHDAVADACNGMAYPSNVISPGKNREAIGHSAAYPVGLPEFFIKAYSDKDDLILDPFLGSGTTLIAAARQGRKCYGMEISPAYCDVIRKRWGDYAKENDLEAGSGAL